MRSIIVVLVLTSCLAGWTGAANPSDVPSYAVALSNNGHITGELIGPAPDTYLWRDGEMTLLPFDEALAVNDRGQVVGYTPDLRGALWERGRTIELNAPGDTRFYFPEAINNRGQVAGIIDDVPFGPVAFIWDNGTVTELGPCLAYIGGGAGWHPNSTSGI